MLTPILPPRKSYDVLPQSGVSAARYAPHCRSDEGELRVGFSNRHSTAKSVILMLQTPLLIL